MPVKRNEHCKVVFIVSRLIICGSKINDYINESDQNFGRNEDNNYKFCVSKGSVHHSYNEQVGGISYQSIQDIHHGNETSVPSTSVTDHQSHRGAGLISRLFD